MMPFLYVPLHNTCSKDDRGQQGDDTGGQQAWPRALHIPTPTATKPLAVRDHSRFSERFREVRWRNGKKSSLEAKRKGYYNNELDQGCLPATQHKVEQHEGRRTKTWQVCMKTNRKSNVKKTKSRALINEGTLGPEIACQGRQQCHCGMQRRVARA